MGCFDGQRFAQGLRAESKRPRLELCNSDGQDVARNGTDSPVSAEHQMMTENRIQTIQSVGIMPFLRDVIGCACIRKCMKPCLQAASGWNVILNQHVLLQALQTVAI